MPLSAADRKKQMILRTINRLVAEGKLILDVGPNGEPTVRLPDVKTPEENR